MALTPKQQRFVEEYLIDLNATEAYKRAGYKGKGRTAENNASRLLGYAGVKAAVQEAIAKRSSGMEATAQRVIQELALLAYSDIGQVIDFTGETLKLRPPSQIPESARRAISSVKLKRQVECTGDDAREVELIEFKLWSKDAALDKLARVSNAYPEENKPAANVTVKVLVAEGGFDPDAA